MPSGVKRNVVKGQNSIGDQKSPDSKKRNSTLILNNGDVAHANATAKTLFSMNDVSPESLAKRLDRYCNDLAKTHKDEYIELADFEIDDGVECLEKLHEMRDEIRQKLRNFDSNGRTDVNLDYAALAGAKVLIEERAVTRSITKKLTDKVGVDENNLLYAGLPYNGAETCVAKEIHDERTESIVASFVDFQKQLKFKLNVLGHAIEKVEDKKGKSKSAMLPDRLLPRRNAQRQNQQMESKQFSKKLIKTPKKCVKKINPFSINRIIDNYALEVASELANNAQVKRPRNLAPIPLDFTILDDVPMNPIEYLKTINAIDK